jgi:hypothetical protein
MRALQVRKVIKQLMLIEGGFEKATFARGTNSFKA